MPPLQPSTQVDENSSCQIYFVIKDENKVVVPVANIATAVYTLVNQYDGAVINSRTAVSFKSTINSSGEATISLVPADNPIVSKSRRLEEEIHVLTATITTVSSSVLVKEIWIRVYNSEWTG